MAEAPQQVGPGPGVVGSSPAIARWTPEYTLGPLLPDYEASIHLHADGDSLWMATETTIARFRGSVWSASETPSNAGAIFTVSSAEPQAMAFGFEGRAWRRHADGTWSGIESPTEADLYDSVADGPNVFWAAGFDFGSEYGVVLRWDGTSLEDESPPGLFRRQLFATALGPGGSLWVGGCDYEFVPYLARRSPDGVWESLPSPIASGCIYDLSFSASGMGLAAAGSDLLVWTGSEWEPSQLAPEEGKEWVRAAATLSTDEGDPSSGEGSVRLGTGWALAATPRWPTYTDAGAPWYLDGATWSPANVELLGMEPIFDTSAEGSTARPFLALAGDGERAWAVSRMGEAAGYPGAEAAAGTAALLTLEDGTARLSHPLVMRALDIVSPAESTTWVSGVGARGLLQLRKDWLWHPDDSMAGVRDLDFADLSFGWAVGVGRAPNSEPSLTETSWHLDDSRWVTSTLPAGVILGALRTLPDGRAWGLTTEGRLMDNAGEGWTFVRDAPRSRWTAEVVGGGAPFDAVSDGDSTVGWLGAFDPRNCDPGCMYRFQDGTFTRVSQPDSYAIHDLQLVSARSGWAIGYRGTGRNVERALLKLEDRQWRTVPLANLGVRTAYWSRMAAVSDNEVWLLGTIRSPDTGVTQQSLFRFDGRWSVFGNQALGEDTWPRCNAEGISAQPTDDGGVEVWLVGATQPCGPTDITWHDGPSQPVSRLKVQPVRSRILLPAL